MTIITCSVDNIVWPTPDIMTLTCTPSRPYSFKAGQYAFLRTEDMPESRAYSIAAAENSQTLTFHIRNANNSPTTRSFTELKAGDTIHISTAKGENTLDTEETSPLVLIAGGVGIAPLYAIIMTAHSHQPERHINLYWGGNSKEDLYLHDNLLAIAKDRVNFLYTPVCIASTDNIAKGHVTDHISHDLNLLHNSAIHIAGPKPMVQHTLKILDSHGVAENSITYDKFW